MSFLARLKHLEHEKKTHYAPETVLPKPPKGAFVSFGSPPSPRIEKKYDDSETANPAPWDAADWQAYFNERAGVAEFDGGLNRHEAEQQAYRSCVAEWLCQHPVTSPPGQCAWCGRGDLVGRDVMPYGVEAHGHVWLHGECWGLWYAQRRQDAVEALQALGVRQYD